MNRLQPVLDVSKKLETLLYDEEHSGDRESLISKATALIDERGTLMDKLIAPFSEEEMEMGKLLIPLNSKIEQRMNMLFNELKLEMKELKQQKRSKQQYKNPYKDVEVMDGMFVDSKN